MNDTQMEAFPTLKTGIVTEIKIGYIRANIPEFEDFVTDWLPIIVHGDTQSNKAFAMPSVGAQVALLMDARGEDGFCLGAVYSEADVPTAPTTTAHHTQFKDGAVLEYNPESSTFSLTGFKNGNIDGDQLNIKAKQTTFDSPVTVNGPFAFTSGMTGSGEVAGAGGSMVLTGTLMHTDGSIISNGVVLHLHVHPVNAVGVDTGKPTK